MKLVFISVTALVAFVAMVALFVSSNPYYALIANPLGSPFGGKIISVTPCTIDCPIGSLRLIIGPPKGGTFIYTPFASRLYREYQIRPGPWVLGIVTGIIRKIGTSY